MVEKLKIGLGIALGLAPVIAICFLLYSCSESCSKSDEKNAKERKECSVICHPFFGSYATEDSRHCVCDMTRKFVEKK